MADRHAIYKQCLKIADQMGLSVTFMAKRLRRTWPGQAATSTSASGAAARMFVGDEQIGPIRRRRTSAGFSAGGCASCRK